MSAVFGAFIDALVQEHPESFVVVATVPGVPVSVNKLYSVFRGKKILSKTGKAFRDRLCAEIARSSTDWKTAIDMVYQRGGAAALLIALYFEDLENKSWVPGGVSPKGDLQNPVKRRDASNYIKVTEDAVSLGCGIDDCNNEYVVVRRGQDAKNPRTEITYVVYK